MTATVASLSRVEGREKVTGAARYAYEYGEEQAVYATIVQSTVAAGTVRAVDAAEARAVHGVIAVLSHENTPGLSGAEGELAVLQSQRVSYRGQVVAAVVAETLEAAREAERLIRIDYEVDAHDVELRADHPRLYTPEKVNPNFETDTEQGDPDSDYDDAAVKIDATYETPAVHNNPMEPHATIAVWNGGDLTLYDSTQGSSAVRDTLAKTFGMEPARVRVISPHVGGGFGSKGTPRPHVVLAALAAKVVGRPVKLATTRQQMFAVTGYRTPTIQRVRLGAGADGRLNSIVHDVWEQTSRVQEFAEQTAVVTRMMYASPSRRTTHKLVALDVPTPSWMRAPGECPGMFALESAMDELAVACGVDPIELRIHNEPDVDPETGNPFSSRNVVACLREGAERFGWQRGGRRDGPWLVGMGVACSTYPTRRRPSQARAVREGEDVVVQLAAADIGTGARTALTQIAAQTLDLPPERVRVELGDSSLPTAPLAGGSMGTTSWGSAVVRACEALRDGRDEAFADTREEIAGDEPYARHAFGAQFVEVRVSQETGEIRVPRALGVFAVGAIVNAKTARSQLLGGMTMGIGMALLEESVIDRRFGDYVNHDLASYHVPVYADIEDLEAVWIEEDDPHLNPMGAKGIGEIGIVGTAAAVANAVHDATGIRFRALPLRPDRVLMSLTALG